MRREARPYLRAWKSAAPLKHPEPPGELLEQRLSPRLEKRGPVEAPRSALPSPVWIASSPRLEKRGPVEAISQAKLSTATSNNLRAWKSAAPLKLRDAAREPPLCIISATSARRSEPLAACSSSWLIHSAIIELKLSRKGLQFRLQVLSPIM